MDAEVFVHSHALVESDEIGDGTRVWAFAHISSGARIGRECNIGEHVYIESGVRIGDRVTIKNGVQVWQGVELENDVFVGPAVVFTNDRYPRSARSPGVGDRYQTDQWIEKTRVCHGASLGAGSVIMCGTEIGQYSMVGAGAVVTRSVPAHAIVVGHPARVRGYACQCGIGIDINRDETVCDACGQAFRISGQEVLFDA